MWQYFDNFLWFYESYINDTKLKSQNFETLSVKLLSQGLLNRATHIFTHLQRLLTISDRGRIAGVCCPNQIRNHHFVICRALTSYVSHNPNSIRSYKIVQKLSPKHAARGVAQSPYPTYRHGKACLSKQPPWRAAGDPRLTRGRSRVRAPGPAGALRAFFFSTLPSFLLREIVFFAPSPPNLWNLWLG